MSANSQTTAEVPIDFDTFDRLIAPGNLGFYSGAQVISIFLHNRTNRTNCNVFTLATLHETGPLHSEERFLTSSLISLSSEMSFGVIHSYLSLCQIRNQYADLVTTGNWMINSRSRIQAGPLNRLPAVFVPIDYNNSPPITKVIKPNLFGCSYILEFFDQSKHYASPILHDRKKLRRIQEELGKHVDIDLLSLPDRLGNFIFQFPVEALQVEVVAPKNFSGLEIAVRQHPLCEKRDLVLLCRSTCDGLVLGHSFATVGSATANHRIELADTNNDIITSIVDKQTGLLLFEEKQVFLEEASVTMGTGWSGRATRTVTLADQSNLEIHLTTLHSRASFRFSDADTGYRAFVSRRTYDATTQRLEQTLEFRQYGRSHVGREAAILDIRRLIKEHGQHGVYLWDPYLSASDILTTLYFNPTANIAMRALGGSRRNELNFANWKSKTRSELDNGSNHLGINLEWRVQHGQHGRKFHDRFLIFPADLTDATSKPKAWSLGTSVNSLGKEHHILISVSNSQNIMDAFVEAWEELDHECCSIWKYPGSTDRK